jgi:hypothetical protein
LPKTEILKNHLTFFSPTRNGTIRAGDRKRGEVILTIFQNGCISAGDIAKKLSRSYSDVFETVESFARSGYATKKQIGEYRGTPIIGYEQTKGSLLIGLALSSKARDMQGVDYLEKVSQLFETTENDDGLTKFASIGTVRAVESGLLKMVLGAIHDATKEAETNGESAELRAVTNAMIPANKEEAKVLRSAFLFALNSLQDEDRESVIYYYRNLTIQQYRHLAVFTRKKQWQTLALMCDHNPKGVYYPVECKKPDCGYEKLDTFATNEDFIVNKLSKDEECPKCKRQLLTAKEIRAAYTEARA